MKYVFLYLMLYSCIGWACESIYVSIGRKEWVNSGFLHGPFCPIYGFGAVFVIYLLSPFAYSPILVFILGILITSTLEYFTSWLLEVLFHVMWWDYSHHRFHINGRVCLLNSFLFGVMAIFAIYIIHPPIAHFVESLSWHLVYVIQVILFVYLVIDTVWSAAQLISFKQQLEQFERTIEEIKSSLSVQLPEINVKEKMGAFRDAHPEFDEFTSKVHERYLEFKNSKPQQRLRHAFPDLKITRKSKYHKYIEQIKKLYEEKTSHRQ